jgi:hypothetical protein
MGQGFIRSIWVSYAGAEQELVDGLGKYVSGATQTDEKPFALYAYVRNQDEKSEPVQSPTTPQNTNNWQRYLVGGEPIQLVVESIATSLRRVIILSPAYLKSEYCLWELCCCLIYNAKQPFIVLNDISDFNDLKTADKLNYHYSAATLVEALCQSYEVHKDDMHSSFHIPDDQQPEAFFTKALTALPKRVYQSAAVKDWQPELIRYALNLSSAEIEKNYWQFVRRCFDEWLDEPVCKTLLLPFKEDQQITFDSLEFYKQDRMDLFVSQLVKHHNAEPTQARLAILYQFSALLTLLRLDPQWVAEMLNANPGGHLLRLSVPQEYSEDTQILYEAFTAAHAIQMAAVELKPGTDEVPGVCGLLKLSPEPAKSNRTREKQKMTTEIVGRVMGLQEEEITRFMSRGNWQKTLRARIRVKHSDDDENLLTIARFYLDQKLFTQEYNADAIAIISEIMTDINEGATVKEGVKIGVLQLLNKPGCDIQYAEHAYEIQVHIEDLLGAHNAK